MIILWITMGINYKYHHVVKTQTDNLQSTKRHQGCPRHRQFSLPWWSRDEKQTSYDQNLNILSAFPGYFLFYERRWKENNRRENRVSSLLWCVEKGRKTSLGIHKWSWNNSIFVKMQDALLMSQNKRIELKLFSLAILSTPRERFLREEHI